MRYRCFASGQAVFPVSQAAIGMIKPEAGPSELLDEGVDQHLRIGCGLQRGYRAAEMTGVLPA